MTPASGRERWQQIIGIRLSAAAQWGKLTGTGRYPDDVKHGSCPRVRKPVRRDDKQTPRHFRMNYYRGAAGRASRQDMADNVPHSGHGPLAIVPSCLPAEDAAPAVMVLADRHR